MSRSSMPVSCLLWNYEITVHSAVQYLLTQNHENTSEIVLGGNWWSYWCVSPSQLCESMAMLSALCSLLYALCYELWVSCDLWAYELREYTPLLPCDVVALWQWPSVKFNVQPRVQRSTFYAPLVQRSTCGWDGRPELCGFSGRPPVPEATEATRVEPKGF